MDDSNALSVEREKPYVKWRVQLTIGLCVWLQDKVRRLCLEGFLPKIG